MLWWNRWFFSFVLSDPRSDLGYRAHRSHQQKPFPRLYTDLKSHVNYYAHSITNYLLFLSSRTSLFTASINSIWVKKDLHIRKKTNDPFLYSFCFYGGGLTYTALHSTQRSLQSYFLYQCCFICNIYLAHITSRHILYALLDAIYYILAKCLLWIVHMHRALCVIV